MRTFPGRGDSGCRTYDFLRTGFDVRLELAWYVRRGRVICLLPFLGAGCRYTAAESGLPLRNGLVLSLREALTFRGGERYATGVTASVATPAAVVVFRVCWL